MHQGGIEQTFATMVNGTYVVRFWMSGNPGTNERFPNGDARPGRFVTPAYARRGAHARTEGSTA